MRKTFLEKLCCPMDKADLNIEVFTKDVDGNILEGLLTCPKCSRYYPIVYGVPIMTPDEYREKSLEEPVLKRWGLTLDSGSERMKLNDTKKISEAEKNGQ